MSFGSPEWDGGIMRRGLLKLFSIVFGYFFSAMSILCYSAKIIYIYIMICTYRGFPVAQAVKNLPAMQDTWV